MIRNARRIRLEGGFPLVDVQKAAQIQWKSARYDDRVCRIGIYRDMTEGVELVLFHGLGSLDHMILWMKRL